MENQEEKKVETAEEPKHENFFKSLFTTYLPLALASIGLVLRAFALLLAFCGVGGMGVAWLEFIGWIVVCVGVFFAIVKMVIRRKLEFDIQLIANLLILIACSTFI